MKAVLAELDFESQSTIRILERVPMDKLDWAPHTKSMTLGKLAWHIATVPAGVARFLANGGIDFAEARPPAVPSEAWSPVEVYRKSVAQIREKLEAMDDEAARKPFTMRRGDQVLREMPNSVMVRTILLNHSYHHRGQLSVYLRLLDVPVPALYGTSADENAFG